MSVVLETRRLTLRPVQVDDVVALWPYLSDPELSRYMSWEPHRSLDESRAVLGAMVVERERGTALTLAIVVDGAPAGLVGLHGIARSFRAWRLDRAELGYWIGLPHQGRGLVTEAAREVVRYGFEELALHKITVSCLVENAASRRVIEKLGFRLVGERRDDCFRDGRWWAQLGYELVVDEWRAAR